jgi:hypothetical protein
MFYFYNEVLRRIPYPLLSYSFFLSIRTDYCIGKKIIFLIMYQFKMGPG